MKNCPSCKSSWIGEPIPEDIREYYSGTHWERQIAIDGCYLGIYDGTVAVRCPDCKEEFPVANTKWALGVFNKYKEILNEV